MFNGEDATTLLFLVVASDFVYIVDLITDEVTIILNLCITLSFGSLTTVRRLIFYQAIQRCLLQNQTPTINTEDFSIRLSVEKPFSSQRSRASVCSCSGNERPLVSVRGRPDRRGG